MNKYEWSEKDTRTLGVLIFLLTVWFAFEKRWLCFIEEFIIHKLFSEYEHKAITIVMVALFFLYYGVFRLPRLYQKNFFIPYRYLLFPFAFISLYLFYRTQGYYVVRFEYFGVSLLDIILVGVLVYMILLLLGSFVRKESTKIIDTNDSYGFYHDRPIEDTMNDFLGFQLTVDEFYLSIKKTLRYSHKSLSIGITGIWGEGKSSFIYLLKQKFDNDQYIVLSFNPRHAKSKELIQQEFFQLLFDELKTYDMRFSNSFSNYLKAINVIDDSKVIDFLRQGREVLFDKEDEKDKINQALERIRKRIVVFIEDLDRLLDEEIIEVFKLLDGNASFDNMLFITAYDKEYVNQILEKYNHGAGSFIDKFFTVEKPLPYVSPSTYVNYLIKELRSVFGDQILDIDYDNVQHFAVNNLLTLRDCKRFLNRFVDDYKNKQQGVSFIDFFLLTLIDYRWRDNYEAIRNMRIVEVANSFNEEHKDRQRIYVREDWYDILQDNLKSKNKYIDFRKEGFENLFLTLFRKDTGGGVPDNTLAINNKGIFDNYFKPYVNKLSNPFTVEKMLSDGLEISIPVITEFFEEKQTEYLYDYLYRKKIELLIEEKVLYNFIDIIVYLLSRHNDFNLRIKLISMLREKEVKRFNEIGLIKDENNYKEELAVRLKGHYPNAPYYMIGSWIKDLVSSTLTDDTRLIFDKEELLEINKLILQDLIESEPVFKLKHLDVLFNCLSNIDKSEGHSKSILDRDACEQIKKLIEENPKEYFLNFVRLEMTASSLEFNNITCIDFWDQIFAGEIDLANRKEIGDVFKAFISKAEYDGLDKITTVRNFWPLYEANEYNSIQFEFQGNVQEKIDNELKEERLQLDEILTLQNESLNTSCTVRQLRQLQNRIRNIGLNVRLRDRIYSNIDEKISDIREEWIKRFQDRMESVEIMFSDYSSMNHNIGLRRGLNFNVEFWKLYNDSVSCKIENSHLVSISKVDGIKDFYEYDKEYDNSSSQTSIENLRVNDIIVLKDDRHNYGLIKITGISTLGDRYLSIESVIFVDEQ